MVRMAAIEDWLNSMPDDDEEADRHDDIVDRRDDGADRELPFEAEPDIDEDQRPARRTHADRALRGELAGDRRADGFDAAEIVVVLQFVANLGDDRSARRCRRRPARPTRISTSPALPNSWTCTSPMLSSDSRSRISPGSALPSLALSSMIEPPLKSMP